MIRRRLLFRVCIAGAALALLSAALTVYVFVRSGGSFFPGRGGEPAFRENFHQKLRDYDDFAAAYPPFADLSRRLDALEKEALGTESRLSLLKRRRFLALGGFSGGWEECLAAAERAADRFPGDEAVLAVASEAAARCGFPEKALGYASGITEKALLPLAFGAASLAGAFETPEKAAALERSGDFFLSAAGQAGPASAGPGFVINAAIVRVLAGDVRGAGQLIPSLSGPVSGPDGVSGKALNFAAEYYYDFGDLRRAAEIYARLGGEENMGRAADALALAGDREHAKSLWIVLSSPDENGFVVTPPALLARSLYNLAAASEAPGEKLNLILRALSIDPGHLCSLVLYSRLLPLDQALALLANSGANRTEPLVDLELLRRRREEWPVEKMIPETWLLLNRHHAQAGHTPVGRPGAAILYRWGCYYFDFQKQYGESARLIRSAERNGIGGLWLDFHRALALLRENNFAEAEALLLAIEEAYDRDGTRADAGDPAVAVRDRAGGNFWPVPANLGRIREAARSFDEALGYYKTAASRAGGVDAARIWYRAAGCLRALGRDREARAALEQGLSLDGENLPIRLELTRLNELGIF
ncbi:MAG: hypothetical protein LBI91_04395 [Spirochaetaceae bacterium]|jgi:tetratricopeptide (TPR) repeat protein|nr:hypothetical protein [Spirochaetaceae bacterium]